MSRRGDKELAKDIAHSISKIQQYTRGLSFEAFLGDSKTQDAVVRNLEIIGEAAKGFSAEFRQVHEGADWKAIAGMRDRLIHGYFGVSWQIVWSVVTTDLPKLKGALKLPPITGGK